MNKEKWIDQVMNATNGMQSATPQPGLLERVNIKFNSPHKQFRIIYLPAKQWVAAAILLLALNTGAVIYALGQNTKTTNTTNTTTSTPLAAEIQSGSSTYNY